jgi:hypothetical protein
VREKYPEREGKASRKKNKKIFFLKKLVRIKKSITFALLF